MHRLSPSPKGFLATSVLAIAFSLASTLFLSASARAQNERILRYYSDIELRSDASMLVRESIWVLSAGKQIRHGIYRDFPTRYTDRLGNRYVVGFKLLDASRNGAPEETRVEDIGNGKRIYLGRSEIVLKPGMYRYSITYETNRELGFFPGHDELFWNATGNGWIFPIEAASASVRLPAKIPASKVHLGGYTGPQGSTLSDLAYPPGQDGTFSFVARHPLPPASGLTILLDFPKGYVTPPTRGQKIRYFVQDNPDAIIAVIGFGMLVLYYAGAWFHVGRDPARGTIVVQYEPPRDFSPAAIRYLVKMGYDNKVFASSIIDMAVRGFITIKEQEGIYTLYRTKTDSPVLSPDEKAIADKLFGNGTTEVCLHNENHQLISSAIAAIRRWLKTTEEKTYFVTNSIYLVPAIVFSVVMVLAINSAEVGGAARADFHGDFAVITFMSLWLSVWSFAVYVLSGTAVHLWRSTFEKGSGKATVSQAIAASLFALPFMGGEILGFWVVIKATSVIVAAILMATVGIHLLFHHLLKAHTRAGRSILDKIEGFKVFLSEVDGDHMNRLMPVNKTPEVFEKYLPYALSLDVEQAWARRFASVLHGATRESGSLSGPAYSPAWFSGNDFSSLGAAGFAGSLAGSFSNAIAASSSAPGSGGGGGGGGGSGGGGGGGGGGGW